MAHARPEYAIVLAVIGVLLAIGIPALQHDQLWIGGICIALAVLVVGWVLLAVKRSRE